MAKKLRKIAEVRNNIETSAYSPLAFSIVKKNIPKKFGRP